MQEKVMVMVMVVKVSLPFYLSVYRSLPVQVSGRGVRLISSATVKGRGRKEEGYKHLGIQLVLMTFHMQHPGSAVNITNCFISIRIGRHARQGGGREGVRRMKRGFEDSNQTCCDINTAQSGNLVGKIRYDYRECEQRDRCSQSNQQLFEAISR